MPDWPPELAGFGVAGPISTAGEGSQVADVFNNTGALFTNAVAWGTANTAIFAPVVVSAPITVYQMAWLNSTVVAGNVDVGIYDRLGSRIVSSGSTAQTGTSAVQVADITDTALLPALYYLAMVSDDATATFMRGGGSSSSPTCRSAGMAIMAAAFPLPATATFAGFSFAMACPLLMGSIDNTVI